MTEIDIKLGYDHAITLPSPASLSSYPNVALFLDFDGTLVDIADHPDAVVVASHLASTVTGLSRLLNGRVAIVTGRSIAALEVLLGSIDVAIAGSHGGEFRAAAGAGVEPLADPIPASIVQTLERFAHDAGGLLVEPKPFSVAVHYRQYPQARDALLACAHDLAATHELGLKHGKQVVELTMPGSDKGTAVRKFMALPTFTGATPLFLGDDVTDEDAFKAVAKLGGHGVLVGEMRPTAARFRLPDVAAVHAWLTAGLHAEQENSE